MILMYILRATDIFGTDGKTCHQIPAEKPSYTDYPMPPSNIPGLHEKAELKDNTDQNLPTLISHDEPSIRSPTYCKALADIRTDNENWAPGSYEIKCSGFYESKKESLRPSVLR